MNRYTRLQNSNATFFDALSTNGFGIVTVMDVDIYDPLDSFEDKTAYGIVAEYKKQENRHKHICRLDTLKIANATQEGPSKTITGGQFANPLVKFGKTARLEMQDALGNAKAIEALCGGFREWEEDADTQVNETNSLTGLHFGEDFQGPKTLIGSSFVVDRKTGQQVEVVIVFYQFLPDSIFNLTQDAEGDATVFDMNGDLLTTVIRVGNGTEEGMTHGVFYSILDPKKISGSGPAPVAPKYTVTLNAVEGVFADGNATLSLTGQTHIHLENYETPTRSQYKFIGWYTDEQRTILAVDNNKLSASITLYAGWEVIEEGGEDIPVEGTTYPNVVLNNITLSLEDAGDSDSYNYWQYVGDYTFTDNNVPQDVYRKTVVITDIVDVSTGKSIYLNDDGAPSNEYDWIASWDSLGTNKVRVNIATNEGSDSEGKIPTQPIQVNFTGTLQN